ncbi:hypothetical protein DFH09DRAFT_500080 [Mycena vulgaris]|nr:hypothetical protein DFH09DRAFT_500080 [Mycena vulgaris]
MRKISVGSGVLPSGILAHDASLLVLSLRCSMFLYQPCTRISLSPQPFPMPLSWSVIGRSRYCPECLLWSFFRRCSSRTPHRYSDNVLKLKFRIFFFSGSSQDVSQTCPMDVDTEPFAHVEGAPSEREHHSFIPQFSSAHSSKIAFLRVCEYDDYQLVVVHPPLRLSDTLNL